MGLVLDDESKPLKLIYLMSDVCTYKILKISNSFSTKSSGQKMKNECTKITYKTSFLLPLGFILNKFKNFKILHEFASLVK